ncbi:MAG: hypothetical protein BGO03_01765 [Mesorhizobium sp. 61-13]|jgi:predicted DNA-binding transcriptional regulator AlpA|nr:AlpA family phage regulatory protein [Mesorhizobium sp.]OJU51137.1 MAG: hypothetical protein BGO03_01765 [Mesorhizobium sp. 61-13]
MVPDLIDIDAACRLIGGETTPIHRSTLWRLVKRGRYPKPIKIGDSAVRFLRHEIIAAIERAAADRDVEAA